MIMSYGYGKAKDTTVYISNILANTAVPVEDVRKA
jgi:hypothetical protein